MATSTLDARIARLEAILDRGVSSITVDGVVTQYDLDEIRRQLAKLYALRDRGRPRVSSIRLDNF